MSDKHQDKMTTERAVTAGEWVVGSAGPGCFIVESAEAGIRIAYTFPRNKIEKGHPHPVEPTDEDWANATLIAQAPALVDDAEKNAAVFDNIADMLDGWAKQSRDGGWSTHQVKANTDLADTCRRRAAEIRTVLSRALGRGE